jgi:hypothetical protein
MHTLFQIPHIRPFWPVEYRRIHTVLISLIVGGIVGYSAGRLVESFQYGDIKQSYQAQIQELMRQVSECGHAMGSTEHSSAAMPSGSAKTDGVLAINY